MKRLVVVILVAVVGITTAAVTLGTHDFGAAPRRAASRSILPARHASVVPNAKVLRSPAATLPRSPELTYPAEGVALGAPPADYRPPISRQTALASFMNQDLPRSVLGSTLTSATPTVELYSVAEAEPVFAGLEPGATYPAWVVTYAGSAPISFGPAAIPNGSSVRCAFVGILDLNNQAWTEFFQSCH